MNKNIADIYPLSPLQQGMLYHSLLEPESGVYIVQVSSILEGALDPQALQNACRELIERHDIFRTLFVELEHERPLQVVRHKGLLNWREFDWRTLSSESADAKWHQLLAEDRKTDFNLKKAPLMRFTLVTLGAEKSRFLWTYHHAILDGWSMTAVMQELLLLYGKHCGLNITVPALPKPYGHYIKWLYQQDKQQAARFWRDDLGDMVEPAVLGLGDANPGTAVIDRSYLSLGEALSDSLVALCKSCGVTLNIVFQAAWAMLLRGYNGKDDNLFGAVVAGRPPALPGVEQMVGPFINTLPVRIAVDLSLSLHQWLQLLHRNQVARDQYSHMPLSDIQRCSGVNPAFPLFETLLVFENYPSAEQLSMAQLPVRIAELAISEQTSYPVTLIVAPGDTIDLQINYDSQRFTKDDMTLLFERLGWLLQQFAAGPETSLVEICFADSDALAAIERFNQTGADIELPTLLDNFALQVAQRPDAAAVSDENQTLSYGVLDEQSNRMARLFMSKGIAGGDIVGVCLARSAALPLVLLAIAKCGATYVPLDPQYPAERLNYIIENAAIGRVVVDDSTPLELNLDAEQCLPLKQLTSQLQHFDAAALPVASLPQQLAYILYTSGSTGRPKGVQISHRALANFLVSMARLCAFDEQDRLLAVTSLSFDISGLELYLPLICGGQVVVADEQQVSDPQRLMSALQAHQITTMQATPATWQMLVEANWSPQKPFKALCGGDALPVALAQKLQQLKLDLRNVYGPTETTIWSSLQKLDTPCEQVVPIGSPIDNTRLYILDSGLNPLPQGIAGELYIAGEGLAQGYQGAPDLTAERFVPDPFAKEPGQRMYRTGDWVCHTKDNGLLFLNRIDHQVKVRGFRIELAEIETCLGRHPSVLQCAVIAAGSGAETRLVAFVVARDPQTLSIEQLKLSLAAELPGYMVPGVFIELPELPLTLNGKVDRKALIADEQPLTQGERIAPEGEYQLKLAEIWSQLLKLPLERLSSDADLFALGGHSLLVVRMRSAIGKAFGVELDIRQIFDHPTIASSAALIERTINDPNRRPPVTAQLGEQRYYPLTFAQQRMWYMAEFEGTSAHYNMPMIMGFDSQLNIDALERALQTIVERHVPLRSVIDKAQDGDRQFIRDDATFVLDKYFLGAMDEAGKVERLREIALAVTAESFDLTRDLRIRGALVEMSADSRILLLTVHHIAFDHFSRTLFEDEMAQLYQAYRLGLDNPLPPLKLQYPDYVLWQLQWLQPDVLEQQLTFWKQHLQGAPKLISLPLDRPRPSIRSNESDVLDRAIGIELSQGIAESARAAGCTPFMLLFAGFNILLSHYANQDSVVIGVAASNRPHSELDKVLGLFINTLAVHNRIDHRLSFGETLAKVRQSLVDVYAHQDTPLESVIQAVRPERNTSYSPLFQVLFNMPDSSLTVGEHSTNPLLNHSDQYLEKLAGEVKVATHTDLDIAISSENGQYVFTMTYASTLFEAHTIRRMLERYVQLLQQVVAQPQKPLMQLDMTLPCRLPVEQLLAGQKSSVDGPLPLSYHQERLLFIDTFEKGAVYPDSPTYHNIDLRLSFDRAPESSLLQRALQHLVDEHEVLRTRLVVDDNLAATQHILPSAELKLQQLIVEEQDDNALLEAAEQERLRPFELDRDLLVRAVQINNGAGRSLVMLVVHHIIADSRTLDTLAEQLGEVYGRLVAGEPLPSLAEAVGYRQYAQWQRTLPADTLEPSFFYWRRQLRGHLEALRLPESRPRASIHVFKPGSIQLTVKPSVHQTLSRLGEQLSASTFSVYLAAFKLLLNRYCGQDEIIVGHTAPLSQGLASMLTMGPYSNLVVLRSLLQSEASFEAWTRTVDETLKQACDNRNAPFDELVRQLNPQKDMSHTALFDVLVDYRHFDDSSVGFGTEQATRVFGTNGYGKNDIHLDMIEVGEQLQCHVVFNLEIFDSSLIQRLFKHFMTLLEQVAEKPQMPLGAYELLDAQERSAQLALADGRHVGYCNTTIDALFDQAADRYPDNIAASSESGDISYRQLQLRANRLAHYLVAQGVAQGEAVGLFFNHSIDTLVAIIAVLKAGACYVPVSPAYPESRVAYIFANAEVKHVLTHNRHLTALDKFADIEAISLDGQMLHIESQSDESISLSSPDGLCYSIYTSGTTGQPKGVLLEHHNVVRLLFNDEALFDFDHTDVWTFFHSYCFDFSVWEMYGALLNGGKVVIVPDEVRLDQKAFVALMAEQGVTVLNQTPSAFYELARVALESGAPRLGLRWVIFGGDALVPARLSSFATAYPDTRLVNMYGITETTVHTTYKLLSREDIELNRPTIGRPIPTLGIYVLDSQMRLQPTCVAGEMYVGGAGVARGYANNPELTAQRFIADPFSDDPEARLYRTGDIGRWNEQGELEYIGRCDTQVKIRGFRIELGEIEQQLAALATVEDVVVVTTDDNSGNKQLVAYVVVSDSDKTPPQLIDWLREGLRAKLPDYMVPTFYVLMDHLPLNHNGKVDLKQLPPVDQSDGSVEYLAPQNPIQQAVAEIWQTVLGIDKVGIKDNFFNLGGHSLLCAQVQSRVARQLDVELTLVDLFRVQTVWELSEFIEQKQQQMALVAQVMSVDDDCCDEEEFIL